MTAFCEYLSQFFDLNLGKSKMETDMKAENIQKGIAKERERERQL